MRGLRTMLKRVLMGLAALFVAVPACWLLLPDEALREEVAVLIDAPLPAPTRDNAFLMVLGMRVAATRDPIDAGSQITLQHEQRVAAGEVFDQDDVETLLGPDALPSSLTASVQKLCDRERGPCLATYQAATPAIDGALDELAPWITRYRAMTALPGYAETLSLKLESPFPDYGVLVRLAELADISVARRIASPDTRAAALDDFARDIGHWQRVLRDTRWLVGKMFATAVLHGKFRLANELMNAYPSLVFEHARLIEAVTTPLSDEEVSLTRVFEGEFTFVARVYRDIGENITDLQDDELPLLLPGFWRNMQFRSTATINLAYAHFEAMKRRPLRASCLDSRQASGSSSEYNSYRSLLSGLFYNPVGRMLEDIAKPGFASYACRVLDLQAHSRLLDLQRLLAAAAETGTSIDTVINQSVDTHADPYTGAPARWTPATRTLSMTAHGDRYTADGRIALAIGAPTTPRLPPAPPPPPRP